MLALARTNLLDPSSPSPPTYGVCSRAFAEIAALPEGLVCTLGEEDHLDIITVSDIFVWHGHATSIHTMYCIVRDVGARATAPRAVTVLCSAAHHRHDGAQRGQQSEAREVGQVR